MLATVAANTGYDGRARFAITKSYSVENGYQARRRSLVGDAKFESKVNSGIRQSIVEENKHLLSPTEDDDAPTSEDLFLDDEVSQLISEPSQRLCLIFKSKDGLGSVYRILKTIENCKGTIIHIESRPGHFDLDGNLYPDVLLKLDIPREGLLPLLTSMKQSSNVANLQVIREPTDKKDPWFPRHISDLDRCNHLITRYEPDLDQGHPGFSDKGYRQRRQHIADIAFRYKHGEPIPRVVYDPMEIQTWGVVFNQIESLLKTHTCQQYQEIFKIMKEEVGFCAENIPQLEDLSNFLKRRSGFSLRPAAGLLTARDFLASLAFRVFQCTQYIRHHSSPDHSPEPDAIHELIGHIPMLADPAFAQFSQDIGLASIGACDADIEKFATLYWFTVEFGLCKENGKVKAYGAGLLSSYGELLHSLSDKPEQKTFDPSLCAVQPYQDQDYQDVYFVAETLEDSQFKFRRWVKKNIRRPYELWYNPFTQTLEILNCPENISAVARQIQVDLNCIHSALDRLSLIYT